MIYKARCAVSESVICRKEINICAESRFWILLVYWYISLRCALKMDSKLSAGRTRASFGLDSRVSSRPSPRRPPTVRWKSHALQKKNPNWLGMTHWDVILQRYLGIEKRHNWPQPTWHRLREANTAGETRKSETPVSDGSPL